MARLARQVDSGSEDEFTGFIKEKNKQILQPTAKKPIRRLKASASSPRKPLLASASSPFPGSARKRKIGVLKDNNPLMRKWDGKADKTFEIDDLSDSEPAPTKTPSRSRAIKAQALRALEERQNNFSKIQSDEDDDGDGSDNFRDPFKEYHRGQPTQQAPRRTQPRRAAAAKKLVESSEDEVDEDDSMDLSDEEEDEEDEDEEDSKAFSDGEVGTTIAPKKGISIPRPGSGGDVSMGNASDIRPSIEHDSHDSSHQDQQSDSDDIERQLQEQIQAEMSLMSHHTPQKEAATHQAPIVISSDSDSDVFEDASEVLEKEPSQGPTTPARKAKTLSPSASPLTPVEQAVVIDSSENENEEENDEDEDEGMDDFDSDEEEDDEDDDDEEEDEDSDFIQAASDSELEEEIAPPPKPTRTPRARGKATPSRNRFALQSRSNNISSPPVHKARLKESSSNNRLSPPIHKARLNLQKSPSIKGRAIQEQENLEDAFDKLNIIDEDKKATTSSKKKAPTATSASKAEKAARKLFDQEKEAIARIFLTTLDTEITAGELGRMTASTGGITIIWNKNLNRTAGRATYSGYGPLAAQNNNHTHRAKIELAPKVITTKPNLLNTIAHEFCHLANLMITGERKNPHGSEFKAWGRKVMAKFGGDEGIGCGIKVTTKHSYEIEYKYLWQCTEWEESFKGPWEERNKKSWTEHFGGGPVCGEVFGRHSKSLDPKKHACGNCRGKLVQVKPVPRGQASSSRTAADTGSKTAAGAAVGGAAGAGAGGKGGQKTRTPSAYQVFVKENMKLVKEDNPGRPQKEIMGLVAEKWAKEKERMKAAGGTKTGKEKEKETVDVGRELSSKVIDLTLDN